jgi:hypothetical protein
MPALGHDRRSSRQGTFAIHCECLYREAKRRAVLTALNVTLSGVTSQHHVSPDLGVRSENGRGVKSAAHHAASLARADSYSNASPPSHSPGPGVRSSPRDVSRLHGDQGKGAAEIGYHGQSDNPP